MISYKKLQEFLNEDTCVETINVFDNNKTLISQLEIHVEGSEGKIPCFNIRRKETNEICRINFLSAEYLRDKKDPYICLNEYEKKALNDRMHKIAYDDINIWLLDLSYWNELNSKYAVSNIDSDECPDYTQLKEENK